MKEWEASAVSHVVLWRINGMLASVDLPLPAAPGAPGWGSGVVLPADHVTTRLRRWNA